MKLENSAKAIIIRNSYVLLVSNDDKFGVGEWFCLPGGRQRPGEDLLETLRRECKEEISVIPIVDRLLFIREYIHKNHELRHHGKENHKIEFMFLCHIPTAIEPRIGTSPDVSQKGIEWIKLDDIHGSNIFPKKLKELKCLLEFGAPVYWGDVL